MLRLPSGTTGCLFDLDGVLTRTADLHAAAWKEMFDGYLRIRQSESFTPFDIHADYLRYADGKPHVRAAQASGLRQAVVSSGQNCEEILAAANLGPVHAVASDGDVKRRPRG